MHRFLSSQHFKAGLLLFIVGSGPLLLIVLAGAIGLLDDPNPIGPGLLAMLTFWPSVILMGVGASQVIRQGDASPGALPLAGQSRSPVDANGGERSGMKASLESMLASPMGRVGAAVLGLWLIRTGFETLGDGGRGPASALLVGSVCLWVCAAGRVPGWFRR